MRIALAQINTTVGDFDGNLRKVEDALARGRRDGVDLVVFPEQTLPGYPAEDLLEREDFLTASDAAFASAVEACHGIAMALGTIRRAPVGAGNPVCNSVALVDDRRVLGFQDKTLLPTYDVFDEGRYFRPATEHSIFTFRGRRLGLAICEDLWNDPTFWPQRRYPLDPVEALVAQGVELIVAVSASPYSLGRAGFRRRMMRAGVLRHGYDLVYCNLVGGNTTLVFDGASFALSRSGEIRAVAPSFEECFLAFEDTAGAVGEGAVSSSGAAALAAAEASASEETDESEVAGAYRALVLGVRDYLGKSGFRRAVLGLSGGIDSALTAAIAVAAIGAENVVGVSLPSRYSSPGSLADARALAKVLGIDHIEIPIEDVFRQTLETLSPAFERLAGGSSVDVTEENIQARIRGLLLMALSNELRAILLTTGNKSELAVGYCTLYGDMSGGLAAISDVPKTLVYRMARWLNREREVIPRSTIEKAPSAELRPGQTDQDSLPPYEVLDPILEAYIEARSSPAEIVAQGFDASTVEEILRLVDRNEYKRKQAAPGIRISAKAFGPGRRFPIVQRFRP